MATCIIRACSAVSVTVKTGHRIGTAHSQFTAEDVLWFRIMTVSVCDCHSFRPSRRVRPLTRTVLTCRANRLESLFYLINSNAFSAGRASIALSPTSTIGRCRSAGYSTMYLMISPGGVSALSPSSLAFASPFLTTSKGERPSFKISCLSDFSVNASLK